MSELTEYQHKQLCTVERCVLPLTKRAKESGDAQFQHDVKHLVEEILFLRQVLMSHPPALTSARLRAIIGSGGGET